MYLFPDHGQGLGEAPELVTTGHSDPLRRKMGQRMQKVRKVALRAKKRGQVRNETQKLKLFRFYLQLTRNVQNSYNDLM